MIVGVCLFHSLSPPRTLLPQLRRWEKWLVVNPRGELKHQRLPQTTQELVNMVQSFITCWVQSLMTSPNCLISEEVAIPPSCSVAASPLFSPVTVSPLPAAPLGLLGSEASFGGGSLLPPMGRVDFLWSTPHLVSVPYLTTSPWQIWHSAPGEALFTAPPLPVTSFSSLVPGGKCASSPILPFKPGGFPNYSYPCLVS